MKKIKGLLITVGLVLALCACGESDKEQSVGSDTTVAKTEATAEPAQEATPEPTAEPTPEPTPVPLIEGEVECLPEMLNVGVEDWMMQVGYSIIKMDGSMSFSEILTALENSGLGVKITDSRGEEFHLENRLLRPDDELKANVYKDDTRIMVIDAVNRTEDNVRGNDAGMALEKITMFETNIWEYVYFCKGIPMTGKGLTYGSVMEQFSEYVPTMITSTNSDGVVFKDIRFNPKMTDGSTKDCVLRFCFESGDDTASCIGVSYRELEDYEK